MPDALSAAALAQMSDSDLAVALGDTLADRIVGRLGGSVISSSFPAYIGDMIREACKGAQLQQINQLYLFGPECIATFWVLSPDGTLMLEMRDHMGQTFWRGTFRPADG